MVVCVTMVVAPLPPIRAARPARDAQTTDPATPATRRAFAVNTTSHFLRDAVPSAGFAAQPEDTTDDDIFLPEEKDTSQLVWEIAAWVVGAALVAFFIIKVFIEEEPDEPADDDGGKVDPF